MPRQAPPPLHRPPRPARGHLVPIGRVLLGRPYNGRPKTDATWRNAGTTHYDPDQAGWWAHQSYRRRTAIIWTALLGVALSVYGWCVSPYATESAQRLVVWFGIVLGIHTIIYRTRRWQPYKQWTEPTARAVAPLIDIPRKRSPRTWVHLPRGGAHLTDPHQPVVIDLPDNFNWPPGQRRANLAGLAAEAAGLHEFEARFEMDILPRTLTIACSPQPPGYVAFADIIRHWQDADDDELVLGLAHTGTPVKRSLASDAPHVLVSAGPGGGKTELCANLALQRRHKVGARVTIIDCIKRGASAKWAKDVDGIDVIRQIDVAYQALLDIFNEVQRRCESYWHHGYDDTQQELDIIIDEANQTFHALRKHEKRLMADDKTAPSALEAYEGILHVGREADTHLYVVGQRGSARGTGGGDARDAFGIIIGNRFTPRTARMLFDDVGDGTKASLPRSSNHPGRIQVVTGGHAEECQVPLLIERRTKQLLPDPAALAQQPPGRPTVTTGAPASPVCPTGHTAGQTGGRSALYTPPDVEVSEEVAVEAELVDDSPVPSEWVDLRTAAERLHGRFPNVTLAALRNYRGGWETRGEFPPVVSQRGQTFLYDLAAVARFLANRPRAGG